MMSMVTAATMRTHPVLGLLAVTLLAETHHHSPLIHLLLSFGIVGLFLVSIVDSSFVPLPLPGITDIMIVVLAAQHANLFFMVGAATAGSALGGFLSYKVGQAGGMTFLEKHVAPGIYKRIRNWMEKHAVLSVALPAVLPPPMPLAPFVLAAGALHMSRKTFMTSFTLSRLLRHVAAAALGIYFGPHVLHIWNMFSRKYAVPILIAIWVSIIASAGFAFWKLYSTSRTMAQQRAPGSSAPASNNSTTGLKPGTHSH